MVTVGRLANAAVVRIGGGVEGYYHELPAERSKHKAAMQRMPPNGREWIGDGRRNTSGEGAQGGEVRMMGIWRGTSRDDKVPRPTRAQRRGGSTSIQ